VAESLGDFPQVAGDAEKDRRARAAHPGARSAAQGKEAKK
jgi:hypothetical protein